MNERMLDIARELAGDDVLTIKVLAERHGVSPRTIRNDLNVIDDALRRAGGPGIKLERGGKVVSLGDTSVLLPRAEGSAAAEAAYHLSRAERVVVEAAVAVSMPGATTLAALAEMLDVSRTTVINDLDDMKAFVAEGGMEVVSRASKGLRVEGPESARRLFLQQLFERGMSEAASALIERQVPVFAGDADMMAKIVREQQEVHGCVLTDTSLRSIVSCLRIMVARLLMQQAVEPQAPHEGELAVLAHDIMANVCRYCHVEAGEDEVRFLCDRLEHHQFARRDAFDDDAPKVQLLARQFIDRVSEELGIDLAGDFTFFENLANHLGSVLQPRPVEYPDTPLIREVIRDNDAIVRAARACSAPIRARVGRELTELEVGYIALHVCAAIERKKSSHVTLHVAVACNAGVGTSQLLLENLRRSFNFRIVGTMTSREAMALGPADADLIVSSVPLEQPAVEWVQVSPLLTDEDLLRVSAKVNALRSARSLETADVQAEERSAKGLLARIAPAVYEVAPETAPALMRSISRIVRGYFDEEPDAAEPLTPGARDLLTPAHIRLDVPCATWREAVAESARVLLAGGYIEQRYVDAMIENIEENGPYVVLAPDFALPHEGIDRGVNEVGMALIRLTEPVAFGDEDCVPVRFVCCMAATDHRTHMKAFFNLLNMMKRPEVRDELGRVDTPEDAAAVIERAELE